MKSTHQKQTLISRLRFWWPEITLFATVGAYFITLAPRLIRFTETGLSLGHPYLWSDWALHLAMANRFAHVEPSFWFSDHPLFAGGKFTYGFLTNLISGLLIRLGLSIPLSFIIPTIVLFLALIYGLFYLAQSVGLGVKTALLAVFLFFFSAGFGFINFLTTFLENPTLGAVTFPAEEYSRNAAIGWLSGNMVVGLLLPQRAFLLGITLAVWALTLVFIELKQRQVRPSRLVLAGILAGLLPITHMHSFIAVIVISIMALGITRKLVPLTLFGAAAGMLSIPLYFTFIAGGIENPNFFRFQLGWGFGPGFFRWVWNWFFSWGLVFPLGLVGFWIAYRHKQPLLIAFGSGGLVLFALANLILFQPLDWDNSKIFLWAYLAFTFLTASVLARLWRHQLFGYLVPILVILLTFTGALELLRLQRTDRQSYELSSYADIELGEWVSTTDPVARFATAPTHHHPVMVWGARPILMGYRAWALNFGFDDAARFADLKTIFSGSVNTPEIIERLKVSYVVIGPAEQQEFDVNEAYFSQFPIAFENQTTVIYDVRPPLAN